MKKIICLLLPALMILTFFGCKNDDGDLGKQTIIDKQNGYTLVQEVLSFKYNNDEKELENDETAKFDGFNVTKENPMPMNTKNDAIAIAQKEVSTDYNKINVFFDRTQGIWKVVFSVDTQSKDKSGNTSINSEKKCTVYVDEDGYTLALTTK